MHVLFAMTVLLAELSTGQEAEQLCASGEYGRALEVLEGLFSSPEGASLAPERRFALKELQARCLFELGDFPACETQLRGLLEGAAGVKRVACLVHLARALTFQDRHDAALSAPQEACRRGQGVPPLGEGRRMTSQATQPALTGRTER